MLRRWFLFIKPILCLQSKHCTVGRDFSKTVGPSIIGFVVVALSFRNTMRQHVMKSRHRAGKQQVMYGFSSGYWNFCLHLNANWLKHKKKNVTLLRRLCRIGNSVWWGRCCIKIFVLQCERYVHMYLHIYIFAFF